MQEAEQKLAAQWAMDWSKAPEGATHWGSENGSYFESWYMLDDLGNWFSWLIPQDCQWGPAEMRPKRFAQLIERPPSFKQVIAEEKSWHARRERVADSAQWLRHHCDYMTKTDLQSYSADEILEMAGRVQEEECGKVADAAAWLWRNNAVGEHTLKHYLPACILENASLAQLNRFNRAANSAWFLFENHGWTEAMLRAWTTDHVLEAASVLGYGQPQPAKPPAWVPPIGKAIPFLKDGRLVDAIVIAHDFDGCQKVIVRREGKYYGLTEALMLAAVQSKRRQQQNDWLQSICDEYGPDVAEQAEQIFIKNGYRSA